MEILWFLIIGAVAGWIAGELYRGEGFGLVGNIVVGVVGALVGGFLFRSLGIAAYGTIGNIVMAVVGAVIFLFLLGLMRRTA